jgi:SAM-dependent methyltransferase
MAFTKQKWHHRFQEQARWTQSLRYYIYQQITLRQAKSVLEVGCGSGAILDELPRFTHAKIYGLDIDFGFLSMATRNAEGIDLIQSDAHFIPTAAASYDVSLCHFVLLWVNKPGQVIREMVRVTKPGGFVCMLAEPDYGGRIDFPDPFMIIGKHQTLALQAQGANPFMGRQIRSLLTKAGLIEVFCGLLGGQWKMPYTPEEWSSEWEILESDLIGDPYFQANKDYLKVQDKIAWSTGERVLFVPTFYGWGKVPG